VRLTEEKTASAAVTTSLLPEQIIGMEPQSAYCPLETDLFRGSLG